MRYEKVIIFDATLLLSVVLKTKPIQSCTPHITTTTLPHCWYSATVSVLVVYLSPRLRLPVDTELICVGRRLSLGLPKTTSRRHRVPQQRSPLRKDTRELASRQNLDDAIPHQTAIHDQQLPRRLTLYIFHTGSSSHGPWKALASNW